MFIKTLALQVLRQQPILSATKFHYPFTITRTTSVTAVYSSSSRSTNIDEEGRRIRRRSQQQEWDNNDEQYEDSGWENFNPLENKQQQQQSEQQSSRGGGRYGGGTSGWGDNDDEGWDDEDTSYRSNSYRKSTSQNRGKPRRDTNNNNNNNNFYDRRRNNNRSYYENNRNNNNYYRKNDGQRSRPPFGKQRDRGSNNRDSRSFNKRDFSENKINMKELEASGFDHLYGLASVRNALIANQRDFNNKLDDDRFDFNDDDDDNTEEEIDNNNNNIRPEAQLCPYLFVQETKGGRRTPDKAAAASQVLDLARERGIPIITVDKGILNTLSGNRPHQGYVLRCGKIQLQTISSIPNKNDDNNNNNNDIPNFWLVLDEVVDPQNFGALLRSAYFLGSSNNKCGILICSKNSAPPSPIVSAASAGALELMINSNNNNNILYSTNNLPRTLAQAEQDGFRVIGAAAEAPIPDIPIFNLQDIKIETTITQRPTLLVLGSEGHGLRNIVAKSCTEFVRIPSGGLDGENESDDYVDSLNVSVTGGILLWHFLHQKAVE